MAIKKKGLTEKEERFCQEFLVDLNGRQAAIRAGYSEKTAAQIASKTLAKADVSERLAELMKKKADKLEITQERVLKELARVAFSDARKVMSWDAKGVTLKSSDEISDDDAATVSEVIHRISNQGKSVGIKMYDKLSALDKLGKYLELFSDDSKVTFELDAASRALLLQLGIKVDDTNAKTS